MFLIGRFASTRRGASYMCIFGCAPALYVLLSIDFQVFTAPYRPPETILRVGTSHPGDMFAAGTTILEAYTHAQVFRVRFNLIVYAKGCAKKMTMARLI